MQLVTPETIDAASACAEKALLMLLDQEGFIFRFTAAVKTGILAGPRHQSEDAAGINPNGPT